MGITTSNNALQISVVARNIERDVVPKLFVSRARGGGRERGRWRGRKGMRGVIAKWLRITIVTRALFIPGACSNTNSRTSSSHQRLIAALVLK